MDLRILEAAPGALRAGYACPCGCQPSVIYRRDADAAHDECCCGNQFAFGRPSAIGLVGRGGFQHRSERVQAPWGDVLEAAWLIGPSTHSVENERGHQTHHHELPIAPAQGGAEAMDSAIDPVCGMTVDRETQRAKGLVSSYEGREYFFCGKGCKLDFEEDPARYLDPAYQPTM